MLFKRKIMYNYIAVRKMESYKVPYQKLFDVYQLFQKQKIKYIWHFTNVVRDLLVDFYIIKHLEMLETSA